MKTGATRYDEGRVLAMPALHKDDRRISIVLPIQFIKDSDAQTKWVVAIIRDVTKRYLRESPCSRGCQLQSGIVATLVPQKRGNRYDDAPHDPVSD